MVSLGLLTSVILGTVTTYDAVSQASRTTVQRQQATQIAQSDIELIRSVAYTRIGLSASDPGFAAQFENHSTVRIDDPVVVSTEQRDLGGVSFTINRYITWTDVTGGDGTQTIGAFKSITVIVTWEARGTQTVRLDSAASPYTQPDFCTQRFVDNVGEASGVVNLYLPGDVDAPPGAHVLVAGASRGVGTILPGDLLLVVQMGGGAAGIYEYAIATSSVSGDRLSVTGNGADGGLLNRYIASEGFQIIRVPAYGSTTLFELSAEPWDGRTGGVLAADVGGDANMGGTAKLDGLGFEAPWPNRFTLSPARLLPGAGQPGQPGGALVLLRASSFSGSGTISTSGGGGAGGPVVAMSETGGLDALTIRSNGSGGFDGGRVLASGAPNSTDLMALDPPGRDGILSTDLSIRNLTGVDLGVGCEPAIEVLKETTTPQVFNATSSFVGYRITVDNRKGRGTAASVSVTDPLTTFFSYAMTTDITLENGASRTTTIDPSPGDTTPRWGSFALPPGSRVTITFAAQMTAEFVEPLAQNGAFADYLSAKGQRRATYDSSSSAADDVAVAPYSCPVPFTDLPNGGVVDGVINTYFSGTRSTPAGSTRLPIGPAVGASNQIRTGDMLLVIQMQDADIDPTDNENYGDGLGGVTASGSTRDDSGRFEYVVATADQTADSATVAASGAGGGLLNSYAADAGSATTGARRFQVIRVPSYASVSLGTPVALPWDGSVGGVVALDVTGNLELGGQKIVATGAGFRGGGYATPTSTSNSTANADGTAGGPKAEGTAGTPRYVWNSALVSPTNEGLPGGALGAGAPATAGGGGPLEGGGGGGANAGAGGRGENSATTIDDPEGRTAGRGGSPVASSLSKLVLGGGGGGSQADPVATSDGGGGRGGGLVLLRARTVSGSGSIVADGDNGSDARPFEAGAGGGGAGGTVLVSIGSGGAPGLSVSARGAAGGSGSTNPNSPSKGAGGGGGGGALLSTTPISADTAGGAHGDPAMSGDVDDGGSGTSESSLVTAAIPGQQVGPGCRPLLTVSVATTTPQVTRWQGQTATYWATVSNADGRPTVTEASLAVVLPSGFAFKQSLAVNAGGETTRDSSTDPEVGAEVPIWGAFSIPGGSSLTVAFEATIGSVSPAGTSALLSGLDDGRAITARYVATDSTADDVSLPLPVTTVHAQSWIDQLRSSPLPGGDDLSDIDSASVSTAGFGTAPSMPRATLVDAISPKLPTLSGPLPSGPTSATLSVSFAATDPTDTVCADIRIRRASTDAEFLAVPAASEPCVTGTGFKAFSISLPSHPWSADELNDLRIAVIGSSSRSLGIRLDAATISVNWVGASWVSHPTRALDASIFGTTTLWEARLASESDGAVVVMGDGSPLRSSASVGAFARLDFRPVIASSGVMTDGSVRFTTQTDTDASMCWYAEIYSGDDFLLSTVGSPSSGFCRSNSNVAATESIATPLMSPSRLAELSVRVHVWIAGGTASYLTIRGASADITWVNS